MGPPINSLPLGQLVSSRGVQDGSYLVAMMGGCSLVLARDYSLLVVLGSSILAEQGFFSPCDVQWPPLKLWWRAHPEGRGCVLSGWVVHVSTGEVLSTFGSLGSSLILVGLLFSSCEGLN